MQKRLFSELGLSEPILKAVEKLGFEQTSPIQSAAIPALMEGKDIVGQSATGSGKTAAFAIPAIERVGDADRKVQILVLTPTRELATQVAEEFARLSAFRPKVHAVPIYGGASYDRQFSELRKGPQIVIGTPGRVIDHIQRNTLDLSDVKMAVLDECDRMLDMGFREDMERILSVTPKGRQMVFFSATLPPPIRRLIDEFSDSPEHIKIEAQAMTVPTVDQVFFDVPPRAKLDALTRLIDVHDARLSIVFANTQRTVDDVADALIARGYAADRLHGGMSQMLRTRTMSKFKRSGFDVLVATDVAGRGIDVDDLDLVINFDLPYDPEDYVHRIGRTGRAGRKGVALTLISGREIYRLQNVERFIRQRIRRGHVPTWDQVEEKRMSGILDQVRATLEAGKHATQAVYIDRLLDEGHAATDLAAAMLHHLLAAEGMETAKPETPDPFARRDAPGRQAPAPVKAEAKPAPVKAAPAPKTEPAQVPAAPVPAPAPVKTETLPAEVPVSKKKEKSAPVKAAAVPAEKVAEPVEEEEPEKEETPAPAEAQPEAPAAEAAPKTPVALPVPSTPEEEAEDDEDEDEDEADEETEDGDDDADTVESEEESDEEEESADDDEEEEDEENEEEETEDEDSESSEDEEDSEESDDSEDGESDESDQSDDEDSDTTSEKSAGARPAKPAKKSATAAGSPTSKSPASRREVAPPAPGYKWVTLTIGKEDGVVPRDVIDAIIEGSGFEAKAVGLIKIHDRETDVQVLSQHATEVVETLDGGNFEGRTVKAYFSRTTKSPYDKKPGKSGGKGGYGDRGAGGKKSYGKPGGRSGGYGPPRDDRGPRPFSRDRDDRAPRPTGSDDRAPRPYARDRDDRAPRPYSRDDQRTDRPRSASGPRRDDFRGGSAGGPAGGPRKGPGGYKKGPGGFNKGGPGGYKKGPGGPKKGPGRW